MSLEIMKVKIYIDSVEYEVDDRKNLLNTSLSLGLNLPYFCWHPALNSVGACRQCSVIKYRDEQDSKGRIVVACMEPVVSGLRISLETQEAHQFRASVIESLMLNHPHDCPVCDEGGECHLQDMTVMTGHNYRRSTFKKRTFNNQYLGPFLNHEMNRCIECYRCVRFYKDYAGGKDLDVFASRDHVYFGRAEDGVLENEFSGNLIEVCPTGVFTDKTLKEHYVRKWDLSSAPSICHGCSLGCNIIAGERYGEVRRVLNRYNGEVNGYFICDRGRYGYEYINKQNRIAIPIRNAPALGASSSNESVVSLSREVAVKEIRQLLKASKKVIGIGSPKASLESNYSLRALVGASNFYSGVSKQEGDLVKLVTDIIRRGKVKNPSLKEVESYDAVFIIGEDVTNTAPMLALSLRQTAKTKEVEIAKAQKIPVWNDAAIRLASQNAHGPFYLATISSCSLDDIATQNYRAHPDDIARLGYGVLHHLNTNLPTIDLEEDVQSMARSIADNLMSSKRPLIVSGTSLYSEVIVQSAADIAYALSSNGKDVGLVYVVPEANSIGLSMLAEQHIEDAFQEIERDAVQTSIILENDLCRHFDKAKVENLFRQSNTLTLAYLENETTVHSAYVLPVATFAEADGTIVNNEGRAQRFYQIYKPTNDVNSSWRWLNELNGKSEKLLDEVVADMIAEFPEMEAVKDIAPKADYRKGTQKIPRQPHRYSGRTSMYASINVSEPRAPQDPDSALSFTMEGFEGKPPSSIIPFVWSPAWNSAQAINKFQAEIDGPLRDGDPGIRLFDVLRPSESLQSDSAGDNTLDYFSKPPDAFKSKENEWVVLPLYHIFGSEELTAQGPAIASRIPKPYVAMNLDDAARLGLSDGTLVAIKFQGNELKLPVNIQLSIPLGIIGLPYGLVSTKGIEFPFSTSLKRMQDV
jgi:NADH-quinone oxidoreductase subunit G